jgi:hypothetical protein
MANLTDDPEFTANEIYEMQQTDGCEGAASGASFGGIGVNNQPHQQLANRTAFLKERQDVNIGNIATLLAFMAEFVSSIGANGYLKIPVNDIALGERVLIVQWGFQTVAFAPNDIQVVVNWPLAFPTACLFAMATAQADDFTVGVRPPASPNFTKTQGNFLMGYLGDNDDTHPTGFYWFSIGY